MAFRTRGPQFGLPIVVLFLMGACAEHAAEDAPARMVSMSRANLLSCMAVPATPTTLDGHPALSFPIRVSDSGESGNIGTGGMMGPALMVGRPAGSFECQATVALTGDRVAKVVFSGDPPACDTLAARCVGP